MMTRDELRNAAMHVEPILAVKSVIETVWYWHTLLGFTDKWTWGDPPNYGGVSWNGVSIQFSQNADLAMVSRENAIFIRVKNLEGLYQFHRDNHVEIVEPLENKPWGLAGYTAREINGYFIVFAGALLREKQQSTQSRRTVNIIPRLPSVQEYQRLTSSVGWTLFSADEVVRQLLSAPVYGVVAEDPVSNRVVGCALLLGDGASFYYLKDVVVDRDWQSGHVGTAMMNEINHWLQTNAADKSLVALITNETLAPFYQQFGFSPAFSMVRHIQRSKDS